MSKSIYARESGPFLYDMVQCKFHSLLDQLVVGRTEGALTFPKDGLMSRQHFKVHLAGVGVQAAAVEDLGSTNGTRVNGAKAEAGVRIPIKDCTVIEAGDQFFFFTFTQEVPPFTLEVLKKGRPATALAPTQVTPAVAPTPLSPNSDSQLTRRVLRPARVRMLPLHGVVFHRLDGPKPALLKILNLSVSGIGLENAASAVWPATGAILTGKLIRGNDTIALKLKLMRKTPQVVGCAFVEAPPTLRSQIDVWFGLEIAASKMADNSANIPTTHDAGEAHHFVGDNGCELFYVEDAGQVRVWHVAFFGNRVECDVRGKLRLQSQFVTGSITKEKIAPLLIDSVRFLENVEGLNEKIRNAIRAQLIAARTATKT